MFPKNLRGGASVTGLTKRLKETLIETYIQLSIIVCSIIKTVLSIYIFINIVNSTSRIVDHQKKR